MSQTGEVAVRAGTRDPTTLAVWVGKRRGEAAVRRKEMMSAVEQEAK